jgi:hypothetical protein
MNPADFSPRVERWGIQELTLETPRTYANPFRDVQLEGRFGCSGKNVVARGFYDGDHTWKVRLMPEVEGNWAFETVSNDPELNGNRGSFACIAPQTGNHGPVRVENQFHFGYADGSPLYVVGTTLYNWLHRNDRLQKETLETLKRGLFNKIRSLVLPQWGAYNNVEPVDYPYVQTSPGKFDFDRFNPVYFQEIERRLVDLQAIGVEADLILFHPYEKWGFSKLSQALDDAYLEYVTARLSAYRNVWWSMANEFDYIQPAKDWDRVFRVIQQSDPYDHLRSIHNGQMWYDDSKSWVTHCSIQLQGGDTYDTGLGARMRYGKPVIIDEYGYEGNNKMDWGDLSGGRETARHWGAAMSGAYASHGETYVHPGEIVWSAVGGELVGESPARIHFLEQVVGTMPYQQLEPMPFPVNGGSALGKKGEAYLYRFTDTGYRRVFELVLEGSSPFSVELIDPWLMKVYVLGDVQPGVHSFRLPFVPAILRMKNAGRLGPASASLSDLLSMWDTPRA